MSINATKLDPIAFDAVLNIVSKHKELLRGTSAITELWNLCDSQDEQSLIKELFDRFTYLNSDRRKLIEDQIIAQLKKWKFTGDNTIIAATAEIGEVDGSMASLQNIKNKLPYEDNWSHNQIMPIVQAAQEIPNEKNLILFDDFIGSGQTIEKKVTYLLKTLDSRNITLKSLTIISYAAMEFGFDFLKNIKQFNIFCPIVLKKGITGYEFGENLDKKLQIMDTLEKKLQPKARTLNLRAFKLGYDKSEALFSLDGANCPNNVFPILWWPTLRQGIIRDTCLKRLR